jgi:hypothetical protein
MRDDLGVTQWNERGGVEAYEVSVSGYRDILLELDGPKSRGLQRLPVPGSDPLHWTRVVTYSGSKVMRLCFWPRI